MWNKMCLAKVKKTQKILIELRTVMTIPGTGLKICVRCGGYR